MSQDAAYGGHYPGAGVYPKTVGDLDIFKVRAHCRNCGRLVVLAPAVLSKLDRRLDLVELLGKLQCKGKRSGDPRDKGCGARPDELQIRAALRRVRRNGRATVIRNNAPDRILWPLRNRRESRPRQVSCCPLRQPFLRARRARDAGHLAAACADHDQAMRPPEPPALYEVRQEVA